MIAAASPDDQRRALVQRLVLVLAHVRREQRKRNRKRTRADALLDSDLRTAATRFQVDTWAAMRRWLDAQGR